MHIFCHANGFPPGCYQQFFDHAKNADITFTPIELSPLKFPFDSKQKKRSWHDFSQDLLDDLKKLTPAEKFIGVGHSMGAVLLLELAVKYPHLFKRLILLDPTVLPRRFVYASNYLPQFINRKIHPVASKAYARRDRWESKEEAFDIFRKKRLFKYFSDSALWDYVNHGLIKENDHHSYTLRFSKAWEEHCFLSVISTWQFFKKIKVPTHIIAGKKSDLLHPKIIKRIKTNYPHIGVTQTHGGHLFPFEFPEAVDLSTIK